MSYIPGISATWPFCAVLFMRAGGWLDPHGGAKSSNKHAYAWTHTYICTQHVTDPQTLSAELISIHSHSPTWFSPPGSSWTLRLQADTGTRNTMVDMHRASVRHKGRIRSPCTRSWYSPTREQFMHPLSSLQEDLAITQSTCLEKYLIAPWWPYLTS